MESVIILMGATGAGKSYQAELLAKKHGYAHISSGDLLREDASAAAIIDRGELVPSPQVNRLIDRALNHVDPNTKIVLDGYPRELAEADWLERHLTEMGRHIARVILIEVTQATVSERLALRGRVDDSATATAEKLIEFQRLTAPVIAHFEGMRLLARVNGNGSPEGVSKLVEVAL